MIAVIPVLPPSAIPEADSMKAVLGERPIRDPMVMQPASTRYATEKIRGEERGSQSQRLNG